MLDVKKFIALINEQYDTQKEFAEAVPMCESQLSSYLKLRTTPTVLKIQRMADTLGVDVTVLLDDDVSSKRNHSLGHISMAIARLADEEFTDPEKAALHMQRLDALSEAFKRVYGTLTPIFNETGFDTDNEEDDSF